MDTDRLRFSRAHRIFGLVLSLYFSFSLMRDIFLAFTGFGRTLNITFSYRIVIQHCERNLSLALAETCWAIMHNVQSLGK